MDHFIPSARPSFQSFSIHAVEFSNLTGIIPFIDTAAIIIFRCFRFNFRDPRRWKRRISLSLSLSLRLRFSVHRFSWREPPASIPEIRNVYENRILEGRILRRHDRISPPCSVASRGPRALPIVSLPTARLHRCRSPLFASARRTVADLRSATRLASLIITLYTDLCAHEDVSPTSPTSVSP